MNNDDIRRSDSIHTLATPRPKQKETKQGGMNNENRKTKASTEQQIQSEV